jgi:hypothetical protein
MWRGDPSVKERSIAQIIDGKWINNDSFNENGKT